MLCSSCFLNWNLFLPPTYFPKLIADKLFGHIFQFTKLSSFTPIIPLNPFNKCFYYNYYILFICRSSIRFCQQICSLVFIGSYDLLVFSIFLLLLKHIQHTPFVLYVTVSNTWSLRIHPIVSLFFLLPWSRWFVFEKGGCLVISDSGTYSLKLFSGTSWRHNLNFHSPVRICFLTQCPVATPNLVHISAQSLAVVPLDLCNNFGPSRKVACGPACSYFSRKTFSFPWCRVKVVSCQLCYCSFLHRESISRSS